MIDVANIYTKENFVAWLEQGGWDDVREEAFAKNHTKNINLVCPVAMFAKDHGADFCGDLDEGKIRGTLYDVVLRTTGMPRVTLDYIKEIVA